MEATEAPSAENQASSKSAANAMRLNAEQDAAVEMAVAAFKRSGAESAAYVLSGPAGTGKTTTLKAIIAALERRVVLLTPTGRAALRARQASGFEASTIHRWLYTPVESEKTDTVQFVRKADDQIQAGLDEVGGSSGINPLLVIDEASMINREVWTDLSTTARRFGLNMLLVGDGFQLPPVERDRKVEPFSVFGEAFPTAARVDLTEVFRQALDSPILRAATELRLSSWGAAQGIFHAHLPAVESVGAAAIELRQQRADAVVITYTNATRLGLNRTIRVGCGIPDDPEPGVGERAEPLLVRRNSYDLGVMNGEIIELESWKSPEFTAISRYDSSKSAAFRAAEIRDCRRHVPCLVVPAWITGGEAFEKDLIQRALLLARRGIRQLKPGKTTDGEWIVAPGDYSFLRVHLGYAVTCHAAQGSEWASVIVVIENALRMMTERDRLRWLYTAITRGKTSVSWGIR